MNYQFRINRLVVEIGYDNECYLSYFEREFGLLKTDKDENSIDIKINIDQCKYILSKNAKSIRDNFWVDGNVLIQRLVAFRRTLWIEYFSLQEINLYIEYKDEEKLERFINPFFESRSIACLSDFFHNPFILILQVNLLNLSGALFHCSSYIDSEDNVYVLSGMGQTGKSSIVHNILLNDDYSYGSEDFSFVFSNGEIYGYPHQCRVKDQDFQSKLEKGIYKYNSVFDRANYFVYHNLLKRGNGRHFSVRDYYESDRYRSRGQKPYVFNLDRECNIFSVKTIEIGAFLDLQIDILSKEFLNMASVIDLLDSLVYAKLCDINFEQLILKIKSIYRSFYCNCSGVYLVNLPVYNDVYDAAKAINNLEGRKGE